MSDKEQAEQALRKKAEEISRTTATQPSAFPDEMSADEARRLLHELRVHQIELEMQNAELRRTQEELDTERRRYFDLYDIAPVGYCTVSEAGLLLEANLAAINLLGVTRDTLPGQRMSRFILEEGQDGYYLFRKNIFASGQPQSCELRMVKKDGTVFWAHLAATMAEGANGSPVYRIVLSDISARKQAEEKLQQIIQRYELVLEGAGGGIWDWNLLDKTVHFSSRWKELRGYTNAEIGDCATIWSDNIHPDDKQAVMAEVAAHFAGKTVYYEKEYRVRCKDGSWKWIYDRGKAIKDSTGKVVRMAGSEIDITERKLAEKNILEMERKLLQTEKLESLGILAGGIAHDFNNILSIILGHCTLMDEDIDAGLDVKTHVNLIEKAANRAADLCWQMLTYSGNTAMIQALVSLRSIVAETVELLQPSIKESVTIELDLFKDTQEIIGDRSQIQQVLMNLVINAAEAIGDRNGVIKIALNERTIEEGGETDFLGKTIAAGSYACLTVSDTGSGMDGATQKRLFEPFYTTKFNGRGLGMSPVLGIIKSHGGALQLSTQSGVGTTFSVYFPIFTASARVETVQPSKASPAVGLLRSLKGSGTILLVDNQDSQRTIGSALLKAMGFSTMIAMNSNEAVEICGEHGDEIDLILLGLTAPETAGIDAYRHLRKISPTLPIVIGSCYSGENLTQEFILDPFSAVVRKPYKPDELRDTFKKFLDKPEEDFHDKTGR